MENFFVMPLEKNKRSKEELEVRYEMKEERALKRNNVKIKGELYEVGNRVIRIGEVKEGYEERKEYKKSDLAGTLMCKYAEYVKSRNRDKKVIEKE